MDGYLMVSLFAEKDIFKLIEALCDLINFFYVSVLIQADFVWF
jgi:hypothetical protein